MERNYMITSEFILKILTYFWLYSFAGWVLESVFKSILERKLVNSGFLHGPFCPIYGIGALIMYGFLNSFKANPIAVFFIAFIVLTVWEYLVGIFLEKAFHTKYWDYSNNKFNINGRICLMNSIFWGILGVLFVEIIHPFVETKVALLETNILIYINILIYAYLLTDCIISVIKVKNWDIKLKTLGEIGETIKEKLEEIQKLPQSANKEALLQKVEELKNKQARLKRKLYRHAYRLKTAFPTMKSETITNFLNQKIEEIKKRQKEK